MSTPDTRPIPSGRYAAPDPAPNTPTECPRCGAPAISRRGVALHDLEHRDRDLDARRQKVLLDRLEALLDSIETNVDPHGERLTLGAWIEQTDHALDGIEAALGDDGWVRSTFRELADAITGLAGPAAAPAPITVLPWPGDPGEPDEPDDRDADEIIPSSATHSFPGDPASVPELDPIEPDDDPPVLDRTDPAPLTPAIDRDDDWGLR